MSGKYLPNQNLILKSTQIELRKCFVTLDTSTISKDKQCIKEIRGTMFCFLAALIYRLERLP